MLLMVLPTGDAVIDKYEFRSALLARDDEAELDDLRNDVRRLCGENRAEMAWKREGCILAGWVVCLRIGYIDAGALSGENGVIVRSAVRAMEAQR